MIDMDYEKKYNEALKRAEAAINIAADKDLVKGVATTVFPELKYSEDERIRKELLKFLQSITFILDENGTAEKVFYADTDIQKIKKWIAWLEKQKEQKPAEWSEEDEKMLNRIINDYENGDEYWFKAQCSTPFRPKIAWLKSLRPSWKPSEEQMKALAMAVTFFKTKWTGAKVKEQLALESLHEDLNKLM